MIKYVNQDPNLHLANTHVESGQCLDNMGDSFKCTICQKPPVTNVEDDNVELDNADYDVADQFFYLGDIVRAVWHAKAIKISRVRPSWKKIRELLPLLTSTVFSHKLKEMLYTACVRRVMLYSTI